MQRSLEPERKVRILRTIDLQNPIKDKAASPTNVHGVHGRLSNVYSLIKIKSQGREHTSHEV